MLLLAVTPQTLGQSSSSILSRNGGRGIKAARVADVNPFIGATFYVNPDYAKSAAASLAKVAAGSTDAKRIQAVQGISTGVWLDRIDAIKGGAVNGGRLSLTQHFDAALKQAAAAGKPVVVPIVVYDLPSRDCAALASNGELGPNDLPRYKSEYIDAIAKAITAKPGYSALRIAAIVEPDSLPNMVTNLGVPACSQVNSAKTYFDGVTYAVQKLGRMANVATYLDIGHSGWLGWPDNLSRTVALYADLIKKAEAGGAALVRGLATDIANYTPLVEPFLSPNNQTTLGSRFYEYNPVFDEQTYVSKLSTAFANAGISGLGFVIDTSRSGWKPVNDGTPIDNRKARGNWCNVNGAGIGERPRAKPLSSLPMLDAFVWIKPPGESDGSAQVTTPGNVPDAEGKRFDPSCDPNDQSKDAMAGAPPAGTFFHNQFLMLARNANPPLATGPVPTPRPTVKRPTARPTPRPTPKPTVKRPTAKPTRRPTAKPTAKRPTVKPSPKPTPRPTVKVPTAATPRPTTKATPTAGPVSSTSGPTAAPGGGSGGSLSNWAQCGGRSGDAATGGPFGDFAWASQGGGACATATCTRSNEWYWQCIP